MKYKLRLRLFLFFASKTQNVWCVAHSVICVLQGLRKRKMNKVIQDRKYIASYPSSSYPAFLKPIMN